MTITWASVGGTIGSYERPKSAAKNSFCIERRIAGNARLKPAVARLSPGLQNI
jgi:hypothetical protein